MSSWEEQEKNIHPYLREELDEDQKTIFESVLHESTELQKALAFTRFFIKNQESIERAEQVAKMHDQTIKNLQENEFFDQDWEKEEKSGRRLHLPRYAWIGTVAAVIALLIVFIISRNHTEPPVELLIAMEEEYHKTRGQQGEGERQKKLYQALEDKEYQQAETLVNELPLGQEYQIIKGNLLIHNQKAYKEALTLFHQVYDEENDSIRVPVLACLALYSSIHPLQQLNEIKKKQEIISRFYGNDCMEKLIRKYPSLKEELEAIPSEGI